MQRVKRGGWSGVGEEEPKKKSSLITKTKNVFRLQAHVISVCIPYVYLKDKAGDIQYFSYCQNILAARNTD